MAKIFALGNIGIQHFNSSNLASLSLYELVFERKLKILLEFVTNPDIKVSGTFTDYYQLLEKRLKYLHDLLQQFKSCQLAMTYIYCEDFQYNSGDLVYIISPLTSQLRTNSRKVTIKYVGPLIIYKIADPHNCLLMTLDGKILRGLFEFERLKPATLRTNHGNVST